MSIVESEISSSPAQGWSVAPRPQNAQRLRQLLDAACELRAADDAYGPGDGYFAQDIEPLREQCAGILGDEFQAALSELVVAGLLRDHAAQPGAVWVTNSGWRAWSQWRRHWNYLLPREKPKAK